MQFTITTNAATAYIQGQRFVVSAKRPSFAKFCKALKDGNEKAATKIAASEKAASSRFIFDPDGTTTFDGHKLHHVLAKKLASVWEERGELEAFTLFCENFYRNPSADSIDDLYAWLEKNDLPITSDGHFLAYKRVRTDYRDCHSGTMDNSPGRTVSMPREDVDPNRRNECSTGLHFASKSYLKGFGGARTVVVKINPADVVAVPTDYNRAKGRAWRYVVVGEFDNKLVSALKWDAVVDMPPISEEHKDEIRTARKKAVKGSKDSFGSHDTKRDDAGLVMAAEKRYDTPIGWVTGPQMIKDLKELDGSVTELAKYYQIPRSTLYSRLQALRLPQEEGGE